MKINNNKEIKAFFKRCDVNLDNSFINDYVGVIIESKEDEQLIKQELCDIGDPEFKDKNNWPSLYLDIDEFLNTPYHKNIHLDKIVADEFEYNYDEIPANVLFNIDQIKTDPNKEMNDYMVLRAFNKPYRTTILKQNGEYWMTDNPVEANTINPSVAKAKGKVLTFGLGIGYFIYMCLLKKEVEEVTVVELNPAVIKMFKENLLPQFPRNDRIKIIEGDALAYFNKDFIEQFDFVFVDVWMNHLDGFEMMDKMLENYLPEFNKVDFWIESSCMEIVTSFVCQYFETVFNNKKFVTAKQYRKLAKKIESYFSKLDQIIDSSDQLKEMMYNPVILREILNTKVN